MMHNADTMDQQLDISAAIARFEMQSRMDSWEFRRRFLSGEFGRVAWARTWYSLLG